MKASIRLTVNGTLRQAEIDTRTLLADTRGSEGDTEHENDSALDCEWHTTPSRD